MLQHLLQPGKEVAVCFGFATRRGGEVGKDESCALVHGKLLPGGIIGACLSIGGEALYELWRQGRYYGAEGVAQDAKDGVQAVFVATRLVAVGLQVYEHAHERCHRCLLQGETCCYVGFLHLVGQGVHDGLQNVLVAHHHGC